MPSNDTDRIKERLPIAEVIGSYVKLERAGSNYKARCPFHSEKTPSFFVTPSREGYHCFGCGAKGDIFSFVQEFEGLDFPGALKVLASRAGIELSRGRKAETSREDAAYAIMEEATAWFSARLAGRADAIGYLSRRGLSQASIDAWKLGFAPDNWRDLFQAFKAKGHAPEAIIGAGLAKQKEGGGEPYDRFRSRIMFPLFDTASRPVAFSGRLFGKEEGDGAPKYLNSPETPIFVKSKVLYGLHAAKHAIRQRGYSILVEGQMDLVLSHQAGFANTVATSGTALGIEQVRMLERLSPNIIMAFDADPAGVAAVARSAKEALSIGMDVKVARLPDGMDPADAVVKDPRIWSTAIRDSVPIISFLADTVVRREKDPVRRDRAIRKEVLPFIAAVPSSTERSRHIQKVAFVSRAREEDLMDDLRRLEREGAAQGAGSSGRPADEGVPRAADPLRAIAGIIAWQRAAEAKTLDPESLRARVREFSEDALQRLDALLSGDEPLGLEAEIMYPDPEMLPKIADERVGSLVRAARVLRQKELLADIAEAERSKDASVLDRLLKESQEIAALLQQDRGAT